MMSSTSVISFLALAATVFGAPNRHIEKRAQPTLYLAGDSTMAKANGAITGWGVFLPYSLSLPVINKAIGGRSSRSFTVEGRFDEIIKSIQADDIVVIEFGHNDGGSLSSSDNGRTVCPGTGAETCQSTYNGQAVTVHTFPYYLTEAGKAIIAKGGKVIMSSQTPNNPWESGTFGYSGGRFVTYAKDVATALGANAIFVDHGAYTANVFKTYGKVMTDALFPQDHTHTSPIGADVVAKAFVKGLQCGGGGFLKGFVKNATESIEGTCL